MHHEGLAVGRRIENDRAALLGAADALEHVRDRRGDAVRAGLLLESRHPGLGRVFKVLPFAAARQE